MKPREFISSILAVAAVIGAFAIPFWYQKQRMTSANERTITLTGVASTGIWTTDEVTGENYRNSNFKPADIHLNKGESVRLILRSADVTHRFYMPELGVGPVDLIPGHTEEVHLKADKEGVFQYYCTEMCGDCHFHMRGSLTVGAATATSPSDVFCDETKHMAVPTFPDITQEGHYWFETKGCVSCHGVDGVGGIPNFNYARGTVPALNTLASKISLSSKDEVDAFTKALEQKEELSKDKPVAGLSNWLLSFAQYQSVVKTIQGGSPPLKADAKGPEPPLFMPAWKEKLDREQMNSIIAYLIAQQKFEEHKGWGE
jgi:mono/diheme cytochrome c family protein/plastocyanin